MALVVVLVLVAMGTILAVSTFQSSLLQERITGNQRMATQARMGAEAGISAGRRAYQEDDDTASDDALTWSTLTETSSFSRYQYAIVDADQAQAQTGLASLAAGTYVLSRGYAGPEDSPIERMILSQVASDVPGLKAVFTCFGDGCHATGANEHIDGRDYPVPGDFYCTGKSCESEAGSDSIYRTAFYRDDGTIDSAGTSSAGTALDAENDLEYWTRYVDGLPAPDATYGEKKNDKVDSVSSPDHPQVIDIVGSAKMNGGAATSGVIVIEDGGELKINGTAHHEGLIIVKPGGRFTLSNGTFELYGGIVMLGTTTSADEPDLALSGNIHLNYSSEALEGLWPPRGSGKGTATASWQEIY